jgi:GH25 family lysozyme M1 (1,4-beta-N-acetylmuramidase)
MLGIDVSRYQSVTDWWAVKAAKVGFCWVKLTDGGGPASVRGDSQVAGAKSVGIPVGGYHYAQLQPGPEKQADILVGEVRRLGATGLVPMLDLETPFVANGVARDFAIRFCRHVAELGYRPGVYMNNSMAVGLRPDLWGIPGLVIWLARYGAVPDPRAGRFDLHQYSSTGLIPGITASGVDLTTSYTDSHLLQGDDVSFEDVIGTRPDGSPITAKDALVNMYIGALYGGGDSGPNAVYPTVNRILQRLEEAVIAGMYLGGSSTPEGRSMFQLLAGIAGKDPAVAQLSPEAGAEIARNILTALPTELAQQIVDEWGRRIAPKGTTP